MSEALEALKTKSILVVEDDEAISALITSSLESGHIKNFKAFADGEAAWAASNAEKFDLVILDWKIPKVNGFALFNRFRQDEHYREVPILIISGFLKTKDFSLLDEHHLAGKLEKPFTSHSLIAKLGSLLEEATWFKNKETVINEIFRDDNEHSSKHNYLEKIIKLEAKTPNPFKTCFAIGKSLRKLGMYKECEVLLKRALKYNPKSLVVMNELSKLYLQTRRNKEAREMLQTAAKMSPDNIDRICELGSLNMQEMDIKGAHVQFQKALALDPSNEIATSGTKLAESIQSWLNQNSNSPITNYAGLLNAIGISHVRATEFEEGINHYMSTLNHVFDNETKARLAFNLGLGYKKWKKSDEALKWFAKAIELDPGFAKAQEQLNQINGVVQPDTAETGKHASKGGMTASIGDHSHGEFSTNFEFDVPEEYDDHSTIGANVPPGAPAGAAPAAPQGQELYKIFENMEGKALEAEGNSEPAAAAQQGPGSCHVDLSAFLVTQNNRTPVKAICYHKSRYMIKVAAGTELDVGKKLILLINDRGIALSVTQAHSSHSVQDLPYHLQLSTVDPSMNLMSILEEVEKAIRTAEKEAS